MGLGLRSKDLCLERFDPFGTSVFEGKSFQKSCLPFCDRRDKYEDITLYWAERRVKTSMKHLGLWSIVILISQNVHKPSTSFFSLFFE